MTTKSDGRVGLAGPALWTGVVLLTLGVVYPARAADEPAKAEAQGLSAELRQAQEQIAKLVAENTKLRAELKDEQLKNAIDVDQEVKRLRDLLRFLPEKERELAALRQKTTEQPKPAPNTEPAPPDDGPTAEQLKRLAEALRRSEEDARRQAEDARAQEQKARQQAEQARREALDREREARAAEPRASVDPARLEAEIRAARLEAQLHVMKAAYDDLRKEASRLREELDAERKARLEHGERRGAADPRVQQRLDQLEATVLKLTAVVDQLTKKLESPRGDK